MCDFHMKKCKKIQVKIEKQGFYALLFLIINALLSRVFTVRNIPNVAILSGLRIVRANNGDVLATVKNTPTEFFNRRRNHDTFEIGTTAESDIVDFHYRVGNLYAL